MQQRTGAMQEVYIQFQNAQVVVRTDLSAIEQFIRESHAPMLASSACNVLRAINVAKSQHGYVLGDDVIEAEGEPEILFHLLRQMILKEFVRARSDLMWIHAGAVADHQGAIVIAGPSTAGKSTLVTQLVSHGLHYMTDELVALQPGNMIRGYPRIPVKRLKAERELTRVELGDLKRMTVSIPADTIVNDAALMRAIVFCQFKHDARTELASISSSEAAVRLFQTILNFHPDKVDDLSMLADIVRTIPAYSLAFSDADHASQAIMHAM